MLVRGDPPLPCLLPESLRTEDCLEEDAAASGTVNMKPSFCPSGTDDEEEGAAAVDSGENGLMEEEVVVVVEGVVECVVEAAVLLPPLEGRLCSFFPE